MELSAVLLARTLAWVESTDLNPRGAVFYPAIAEALVKRFGFNKYPQKEDEFDEAKGVIFQSGYTENTTIEQFVIYRYGLVVDTRESTDKSKKIMEDTLSWAKEELGLTYASGMIKRWQYESHIVFHSNMALTAMQPALRKVADAASKFIAETLGEELDYEAVTLAFSFDSLRRKHSLPNFTIQRRENTPFSDSRYFSSAPLPTDLHIKLLEEFESEVPVFAQERN